MNITNAVNQNSFVSSPRQTSLQNQGTISWEEFQAQVESKTAAQISRGSLTVLDVEEVAAVADETEATTEEKAAGPDDSVKESGQTEPDQDVYKSGRAGKGRDLIDKVV